MAKIELTLTPEEAVQGWFGLEDAALGKMTRYVACTINDSVQEVASQRGLHSERDQLRLIASGGVVHSLRHFAMQGLRGRHLVIDGPEDDCQFFPNDGQLRLGDWEVFYVRTDRKMGLIKRCVLMLQMTRALFF